jgi:hypothetical protein
MDAMGAKPKARRARRANRRRERRWRLPRPAEIVGFAGSLGRRRPRTLLAIGLAAAAGGGGWLAHGWLTESPRFAIERFEVAGAELMPREAIASRLAIDDRPNLFRYDTDAAARRLESSPWVIAAEVRRSLPDGLEVEIEEHRPRAVLVAGGLYLVGDGGTIFKRATANEALGLVAITGIERDRIAERPDEARRRLGAALEIVAAWRAGSGRPELGEVHLDPVRGATLLTRRRAVAIRVGAGALSEIGARLGLFDRVWAALDPGERRAAELIVLDSAAAPRRATVAFNPSDDAVADAGDHQETAITTAPLSETATWRN